jgi:hypothetical protein
MKPSLHKADLLLNGLDLKSSSVFSTLLINFSSSGSGGSGSGDSDSGGVGSISSSSSSSFNDVFTATQNIHRRMKG